MKNQFKLACNTIPFSRLVDRFDPDGYSEGYAFEKQLELLESIEGIDGADVGWPAPAKSGADLKKMLENHGLIWAISDADIYTEARFQHGSFSNPNPKIRRQAIDRVKEAIDAYVEGELEVMNLWLGQDGSDYSFQGHYDDAWKWIEEGLEEIAEHNPNCMPICLEPKLKEPRANLYIANTGTAIWLLKKLNKPNLALTLDYGHSLAAIENPASVAVMAAREGLLKQIHLNDNRRDWDLDLVPGAATPWELLEFYYWLRKMGYDSWFGADIFPYREDGKKAIECMVKVHRKCTQVADKLIEMDTESTIRTRDGQLEILGNLWDMLVVD